MLEFLSNYVKYRTTCIFVLLRIQEKVLGRVYRLFRVFTFRRLFYWLSPQIISHRNFYVQGKNFPPKSLQIVSFRGHFPSLLGHRDEWVRSVTPLLGDSSEGDYITLLYLYVTFSSKLSTRYRGFVEIHKRRKNTGFIKN